MLDNTEVLQYGSWITVETTKGTLIIVCDEAYRPNLDENRGTASLGIHCTDTERKIWGSLTTISKVSNAYISQFTGLYTILVFLVSFFKDINYRRAR